MPFVVIVFYWKIWKTALALQIFDEWDCHGIIYKKIQTYHYKWN